MKEHNEKQYMTLRELKARIDTTNGTPKLTPCQIEEDSEAVDEYRADDYRITVYKNGFAVAQSGKRRTVVRVDDCGGYSYDFNGAFLRPGEKDGTPHYFDADYFLNLQWPIRIMMEADDQFEANGDRREKKWLSKHPEIPDDLKWMLGGCCSFEDGVINRMAIESILNSMTDKQREVFTLYYKAGYTQQEVAEILGIARDSVKDRLKGAMKKIKKIYE